MAKQIIFIYFVSIFYIGTCLGSSVMADTVVNAVQGKVVHVETGELVEAKIVYESLPYGNKIGVLSGNRYEFPIKKGEAYAIYATAPGFRKATIRVLFSEKNENGIVEQDIEMIPVKEEEHVMRLERLIFSQGQYTITEESHDELDRLAVMLKGSPNMVVQLEGHTDSKGNAKQNMKLSQLRVDAVKEYLVDRKSIEKRRIKIKAFGGSKPIATDGDDPTINRRVEVRILKY